MRHNVVLSCGPVHDFAGTSAELADIAASLGAGTTVVGDVGSAAALLSGRGDGAPPTSLTVNALVWSAGGPAAARLGEPTGPPATPSDLGAVDRFVRDGGGLLALHTAVICFDGEPLWRELCGAVWDWTTSSHPPEGPVQVAPTVAAAGHPVTATAEPCTVHDELYGPLDTVQDVVPLLTGTVDGTTRPVLWARRVGRGRVVTDLLGHGVESLRHPVHRRVLAAALDWIGGRAGGGHEGGGTR